jgi:hypothetical protein
MVGAARSQSSATKPIGTSGQALLRERTKGERGCQVSHAGGARASKSYPRNPLRGKRLALSIGQSAEGTRHHVDGSGSAAALSSRDVRDEPWGVRRADTAAAHQRAPSSEPAMREHVRLLREAVRR